MTMQSTPSLRACLEGPSLLVAPGAYDALGAQLIEQAGFDAVYMTGGGTSLSRGFPDLGLLTMSEMVENAAAMARSVNIPVISDADTGYGDELNVTRTVQEFERRGVAAIHIEDQVSPKRCGYLGGKEIIPGDEYTAKIEAAVAARSTRDFLVIARTDARSVVGFEDAVKRMNEALRAGADIAFVEAPQGREEIAAIPKLIDGPCLFNVVPTSRSAVTDMEVIAQLGYKIAVIPGLLLAAAIKAGDAALQYLKSNKKPPLPDQSPAERYARFGAGYWNGLRRPK